MKTFGPFSQKGKIIQIMLLKGSHKWYQDFEVEHYKHIYVGNSAGSRLSELLKAKIVDVVYFENPNAISKGTCKRAKYSLTPDAVKYFTEFYNIKPHKFFGLF